MQIPKLTTISAAWAAAIEADSAISDYCTAQYGGKPNIVDGYDPRRQPGGKFYPCPFIMVAGAAEATGLYADGFAFRLRVSVGVREEKAGAVAGGADGRVTTLGSFARLDHLAALVLNCLAGTDYLPEQVDGETDEDWAPVVVKNMVVTTATEAVMDGSRTW